jgi:hypothetical protein
MSAAFDDILMIHPCKYKRGRRESAHNFSFAIRKVFESFPTLGNGCVVVWEAKGGPFSNICEVRWK